MGTPSDKSDDSYHRMTATDDKAPNDGGFGASDPTNKSHGSGTGKEMHRAVKKQPTTTETASVSNKYTSMHFELGGSSARNPNTLRGAQPYEASTTGEGHANAGHSEEEAMNRAIKLSLADQAAISSLTIPDLLEDMDTSRDDVRNKKSDSARTPDTKSACTSRNPKDALQDLASTMATRAENLEKELEKNSTNTSLLVKDLKKWSHTTAKVVRALERTEANRVKHVKTQLDVDREIEEKHRKQVELVASTWQEKLRLKEQEWEEKIEEAKHRGRVKLGLQWQNHGKELYRQQLKHKRDIVLLRTKSLPLVRGGDLNTVRETPSDQFVIELSSESETSETNYTAGRPETKVKSEPTTGDHELRSPKKRKRETVRFPNKVRSSKRTKGNTD